MAGHRTPHHPTKAQTPRKRKHPSEHTQPHHPRANTPTTSLSKYAPKRTQASVPTPTRVGTPSVSAGTRVLAEATGMKQSRRNPKGGHAG